MVYILCRILKSDNLHVDDDDDGHKAKFSNIPELMYECELIKWLLSLTCIYLNIRIYT